MEQRQKDTAMFTNKKIEDLTPKKNWKSYFQLKLFRGTGMQATNEVSRRSHSHQQNVHAKKQPDNVKCIELHKGCHPN